MAYRSTGSPAFRCDSYIGNKTKQPRPLEDGNWMCDDSKCANVNYPRRTECNKCGKKRGPVGDAVVKAYIDMRMQRGESINGSTLISSEDWLMGIPNASLSSQFRAENGNLGNFSGNRVSALQEGKRLAEQLVGLFASTSDPIGDATDCLTVAAHYLQKMRNRLHQLPSPLDRPICISQKPAIPPNSTSPSPSSSPSLPPSSFSSAFSSSYSSPFSSPFSSLRLRAFATAGGRGLGNGSASSLMSHNSSFGGFSEDVAWPNPMNGNSEKTKMAGPNNNNEEKSYGGIDYGGYNNGGNWEGNGYNVSYENLPSYDSLSCSSFSNGYPTRIQSPVTSPPNGRVLIPRPVVKFEDYKDRPSEYLREFGDPAAMGVGGASPSQRPEAGIDGNWECQDCKNVNFPRRTICHQCHKKRGSKGEEVVREYVRRLIEGV